VWLRASDGLRRRERGYSGDGSVINEMDIVEVSPLGELPGLALGDVDPEIPLDEAYIIQLDKTGDPWNAKLRRLKERVAAIAEILVLWLSMPSKCHFLSISVALEGSSFATGR